MSDHPNVANAAEMDWVPQNSGEKFANERKQLGVAAGGRALGCSLFRVPPGKCAFPRHSHQANEEAVYILRGTATLRKGDVTIEVGPGDYIAHPAGGPAHQMRNSGEEMLEYLCVSTMTAPEVVIYPDSGKIGVITGSAPGGAKTADRIVKFFPKDADVSYWEGE